MLPNVGYWLISEVGLLHLQERTLDVVPGYNGIPIWSPNRAASLFALDTQAANLAGPSNEREYNPRKSHQRRF